MSGALYLVPTLIGAAAVAGSLPSAVLTTLQGLDGFVAENAKSARQFLKVVGYPLPLSQVTIAELSEHTRAATLPHLLAPLLAGKRLGLLSEAGCPGVADPGAQLVALAHQHGVRVVPLVGPSSLLLALMASGLNGQRFCFHGYLPVDRAACVQAVQALEVTSAATQTTQLFIETPYRNGRLLDVLLAHCRDDTLLCIASELTTENEFVRTRTVAQWRGSTPDLQRKPTVFLLQASTRKGARIERA